MNARMFGLVSAAILSVHLGWAAGPAFAHHSYAMYNREKTVTLSGTVKEYDWTSPHVTIAVLTEGAKNGVVNWNIEGSSPAVLARGGWSSSLLKPGDKISLGIHPRKDGAVGGLLADDRPVTVNGLPAKGVLSAQPASNELCER
jgi:hypothetical protein